MTLSDLALRLSLRDGLEIDPFSLDQVQPCSYDITLSDRFKILRPEKIGPIDAKAGLDDTDFQTVDADWDEAFPIHPGRFVLGSTLEHFVMPNHLGARVEGKSSIGRLGLLVHLTAGFIDPGFKGPITLEFKNLTHRSILVYPGMLIAQLAFTKIEGKVLRPYGHPELNSKYQNQDGPTISGVHHNFQKETP